jgi:predicted short-subunit dehydrogenase-like oxidoreductase (DUF2520 family)
MKAQQRFRAAIIGSGKVGSVLGRLLVESGHQVLAVISRTPASARKAGRFIGCRNTGVRLDAIPSSVNLVIIATPHDAISSVVEALAAVDHVRWRSVVVCHASGMHTDAVLAPLRKQAAVTFSFHPLQTFPRDFAPQEIVDRARGIYYGVDGTARGIARARRLAKALKGHVVEIPPSMREFYHASCVVASNHLTTLLWVVEKMSAALGFGGRKSMQMFQPIIDATLHNVCMTSPTRALSGPVARGGVETVASHFEAVERVLPDLIPYFLCMTEETMRLANAKGSLTEARASALASLLASYRGLSQRRKEKS